MGIPKFFRWVSERYPMSSQLVEENKIPEFDNLYLDMNGIIHNCSHPDDDQSKQPITEDKMFITIFNYIDHLFQIIKPQKLFFMAVDGVAPRAKMNQQRARRFKTAREALESKKRLIRSGEAVPENQFDSNCITPGTAFMARLSEHLKYFVNKKIKEDINWRKVKVILSCHEVPGEGEHKIMEYIRLSKAQTDYNPNVRHCLYGLDADLVMLGLLSHDPHFSLLREEVVFGRKKKKAGSLDSQKFYLMHLSLVREYLDFEFQDLKNPLSANYLSFTYNLERILDDFVLMAIFVGNDFVPHLPSLHINEGAMQIMFDAYKRILPTLDGYLNEFGSINFARCEAFVKELADFEKESFESALGNSNWLNNKRNPEEGGSARELRLTIRQKKLLEIVKRFVGGYNSRKKDGSEYKVNLPVDLPARDREFLRRLAHEIDIICAEKTSASEKSLFLMMEPRIEDPQTEGLRAAQRYTVYERYDNAPVWNEDQVNAQEIAKREYDESFSTWKRNYYEEKLHIAPDNVEALEHLKKSYIEGLQWVLHYYYDGVSSWGWYYPFHYAPMITDICDISKYSGKINFEIGRPFRPFEQLMGVLPAASKELLPKAYWPLMCDESSPIIDFYPVDFETDLNGKKQEWEAIVLIPFINENRLVTAMKERSSLLTPEEIKRNEFGSSIEFFYDESNRNKKYPTSYAGVFPDITNCPCRMQTFNLPTLSPNQSLNKGLCFGARTGVRTLPGFPTLHSLPHASCQLAIGGVKVFQQESKSESMIVELQPRYNEYNLNELAGRLINKAIFVEWPFLIEGLVSGICDSERSIRNINGSFKSTDTNFNTFDKASKQWEYMYSSRMGVKMGKIEVLVYVRPIKGMKILEDGSLRKEYASSNKEELYPIQICVEDTDMKDPRFVERPPLPLSEDYQVGADVFFLGIRHYGAASNVEEITNDRLTIRLQTKQQVLPPSVIKELLPTTALGNARYLSFPEISRHLQIGGLVLSRLSSSILVKATPTSQPFNIGLNLKSEAKNEKVLGYTRKSKDGWECSEKGIELIAEYKAKFPGVFANLERNSRNDIFSDSEVFRNEQEKKDLSSWLREKKIRDFVRVDIDADSFPTDVIQKIEEKMDSVYANIDKLPKHILVKMVPPKMLLKPEYARSRLGNQAFKLGDRIVSVVNYGSVPFGALGVVVGLSPPALDILFDEKFLSAGDLGGRCSLYRGLTVACNSVLNLSVPQPPITVYSANNTVPQEVKASSSQTGLNKSLDNRRSDSTLIKPLNEGQEIKILKKSATAQIAVPAAKNKPSNVPVERSTIAPLADPRAAEYEYLEAYSRTVPVETNNGPSWRQYEERQQGDYFENHRWNTNSGGGRGQGASRGRGYFSNRGNRGNFSNRGRRGRDVN